jgi:DNA repair protein RecN (Recombination protein N)
VNGKSRAFINDTPINLSQLQELSNLLVDLHQQFDSQDIGDKDFQRDVLDALAEQQTRLQSYRDVYAKWQAVKKQLDELLNKKQIFEKEADYNRFQFEELSEAGFKENELENTEAELKLLNNSGGIKAVLERACDELEEGESPVVQQLKIILNQLQQYAGLKPGLSELVERLRSSQIEIQDIASELNHLNAQINLDPAKIEKLNDRLSSGYKLLKKHNLKTTAGLLQLQNELEEKLHAVLEIDDSILEKQALSQQLYKELIAIAEQISAARTKQTKPFEDKVNKLLAQVGMLNARIKVGIVKTEPGPGGIDHVEFLFNAKVAKSEKNIKYLPVAKVASGGELSRLMLCVKSLVARSIDLPTLVFDEIDTGISGEAARQVGIIMKELASQRQVICITHQPQIAGKAAAHFFVYKEIAGNAVKTNIRQLSQDERITAIAKMLSGEKPTAAAIQNAREMVSN